MSWFKNLFVFLIMVSVVSLQILDTEEAEESSEQQNSHIICHPVTPCGWRIHSYSIFNEIYLTNRYCICGVGQYCEVFEKRPNEGYSEYRCKYPTKTKNQTNS